MLRFPAQLFHDARGAGAQDGRITGPASGNSSGERMPHHFLHRFAYLAHRIAAAGTDVVGTHPGLIGALQSADMGLRDVQNMNIIADAGAVRCGVIIAVNAEGLAFTAGRFQQQRNHVGFRIMTLAQSGSSAAGIEIAKQRDPQAMRGRGVFEDFVRKRAWSGHRD